MPSPTRTVAAELVASALIDEAAGSTGHRRLHLGTIFGLEPEMTFEALAPLLDASAAVDVGKPPTPVHAVRLTGDQPDRPRLLFPYLVGRAGQNSGTPGFAALLRDEVPTGDGARVLLILDAAPVETVRTAAEDAALLPSLRWSHLAAEAAAPAAAEVRPLVQAVLRDDHAFLRLPRHHSSLVKLRELAEQADPEQCGLALQILGCYVADPGAHREPEKRLPLLAKWRSDLERWQAPGQDFEQTLTAKYSDPDDPGLQRVLAARRPFGLDYEQFSFRDLPARAPVRRQLRLAYPVTSVDAPVVSLGTRAVLWRAGGGSVGIRLAAAAASDARAEMEWSDAESEDVPIALGDREARVTVEGSGWRFGRLRLPSGESADLAIFLDSGNWAPFEAGIDIDLQASAFRASEDPALLALGPAGELLGQPDLMYPDSFGSPGEPQRCFALMREESHPIDLIVSRVTDTDYDGDDAPAPGDADEPDGTHTPAGDESEDSADGDQPDDGGGGRPGPAPGGRSAIPAAGEKAKRVLSVPHALLLDHASGRETEQARFFVTESQDGVLTGIITTPERYDLAPQQLASGIDGLALERSVLAQPDVLCFTLVRNPSGPAAERHPYFDWLDVEGLDGIGGFFEARRKLFAAVEQAGSMHAVGAGLAAAEAAEYVEAYSRVLTSALGTSRFTAELARMFLCDSIADPETGELLVAPSSPIAVAYLLELRNRFASWSDVASQVLTEDVAACTLRHLLPYFALQGEWYETGEPAPLLWRRYRPATTGASGDQRPGFMAQRVTHFLRVHPEYRDERQQLGLAFHEPGEGDAVLESLRELMRLHLSERLPLPLPLLSVVIVRAAESPTAVERFVSGELESREADLEVDRLLRDRLNVVRLVPGDAMPFCHLSFVFESSIDREPAAVDVDARAGTLFADGLAAVPGRYMEVSRNETTFMWGTFSGSRTPTSSLLQVAHQMLELVGGMPHDPIVARRTRMPSMRVGSTLLDALYGGSAWVVHLDRLLGLEAFAPDATGRQARYLIDYEDRLDLAQPGLDSITATKHVKPYRRALRQALHEFGSTTESGLDRILQLFNGVSGRWALDMVGANANDLNERIGLATAAAALQDLDGGFASPGYAGVVIPLDEMIAALPPGARPTRDSMCDDLLQLRIPLNATGRVVLRGRLLEVKYRGDADANAAATARRQLQTSYAWLGTTFGDVASPRRAFRSRDLAEIVRSAATRAAAFRLLNADSRMEIEPALEQIAAGEFELRLDYRSRDAVLHGDFVSIEKDSSVPAHRQDLAGDGLRFGHLRLGRDALRALVAGDPMPRPATLPGVTFDDPDEPYGGSGGGGDEPARPGPQGPRPEAGGPGRNADGANPPEKAPTPPEVPIVAGRLDAAFAKYGLGVEPFSTGLAQIGPSVIRFRTKTLGRLSISDVERRARDIGREIAAPGEIQVGDEPGFVTVDVPRSEREPVPLASVLPALDEEEGKPGALQFVAGVAPSGKVEIADLSRLPHLLVAGATGSGKSVFLRGMLVELLRARTPDQLHLLIIDPKRLDFAAFARAPHVRGNSIISDPDEALERLQFTLEGELSLRQPILEEAGVSSASEYYEAGGRLEELPQLVILVDEFADLVLAGSDRKAFSELVQRYAQLTRAYGIFLVLATQRPSVDVVTGSIKANLSARIAFSLPSGTDSRTVLDRNGAEDLLGDGDLLFYRNGRVERLQAPLTTLADVRTVLG